MFAQIWNTVQLYSSSSHRYRRTFRKGFGTLVCFSKSAEQERNIKAKLWHLLERYLSVAQLRQVHAQIIFSGLHQDDTLISYLVTSLIKSSQADAALAVFKQVRIPQSFLWTSMIREFACNGHFLEAVKFYDQMRSRMRRPNNFNIPFALKACGSLKFLFLGEQIHSDLLKLGFSSDVYVQTSVLDMYVKCGKVATGKDVFDSMSEKTVVSWTAMLTGYCNVGQLDKAEDLFQQMPTKNVVTWNVMIDGLCRYGNVVEARRYFDMMPMKNVVSWTTMIGGYSRTHDVVNARLLFDHMVEREVVAWTAMISCYVENGYPDEAIEIFQEMQAARVKADEITLLVLISAAAETGSSDTCEWIQNCIKATPYHSKLQINNSLLNMYASIGSITKALEVFHEMSEKDVVSYNTIISGCASNGFANQALSIFSTMLKDRVKPSSITFTAVLTACAHSGLVEEGRKNFDLLHELGFVELKAKHYSCMVDLLGRAGFIDEAYKLIKSMKIELESSVWGALLGGCKIHGNVEVGEVAANELFKVESGNAGNFCVLANIYSENKMWVEAGEMRGMMMRKGVYKNPGRSLVEAEYDVTN